MPCMIDYILAETGHEQLHYIGHSQGSTIGLVMLAERPEYNSMMKSVQLIGKLLN